MPLYAVDDLDDAFRVTRSFLTPFDLGTWLKLALVVFFVGGVGANVGGFQFNAPADEIPRSGAPTLPDLGADVWLLVAGLATILVAIVLAFLLVGSVMEFVLVESLRHEEVTIRRYWNRRWRQGLRLFGFRLVLGLVVLTGVALLFSPLLLALLEGDVTGAAVGLFLLLLPLFVLFGVFVALVQGFTTSFVVPIMLLEEVGVVDGWRRLWGTIRAEWGQYLAYAVAQVVLSIAAGIAVAFVVGAAALVLLLPFGVVGALGVGLFAVSPLLGGAVVGVVALLYAIALLVVVSVAQVPVKTYLRYYALLILGDVDETLDLVPVQRKAVRSGTPA